MPLKNANEKNCHPEDPGFNGPEGSLREILQAFGLQNDIFFIFKGEK